MWTDKGVYSAGELVVVYLEPPVGGYGVAYGVFILKPDGSNVSLHLHPLRLTANTTYLIESTDPAGLYRVELWERVIYPGATRTLGAYCYFTVEQSPEPTNPIQQLFARLLRWFECLLYGKC
jgi:hypothetical protein